MRKILVSDPGLLAVGVALAAGIFAIDSLLPLGIAAGVPYVAVVLIGLWIAWRPGIFILAGLGTLLTIAGIYTSPIGGEDWHVMINRGLATVMIWTVALLVHYRRRQEDSLVRRERTLGTAIVQSVGAMVIILSPTGRIIRCNHTCETITGLTQDELIDLPILDLIERTDGEATVERGFDAKTAAQGPSRCETFIRTRENGRRRISWSSTPHFGAAGAVDYIVLAGTDITEQFQAREILRKSEELHRNVVENQADLISRSLPNGTLTFVNDGYCSFFGKSREQFIGRKFIDLIHPDDLDMVVNRLDQRSNAAITSTLEVRMADRTGETRWLQWTARPITDDSGNVIEYQSVGRDVTERRRVEDALRESEARFKAVVDHSPSFILLMDTDSRILLANKQFRNFFSMSESELIGKRLDDFMSASQCEKLLRQDRDVIDRGRVVEEEFDLEFLDGRTQTRLINKFPVLDEEGNVVAFGVISSDVTERKQVLQALRESEQRHRQLANISPLAILVQCEGTIVFANPAAVQLFGAETPEDLIGRDALDLVHPEDRDRVIEHRATLDGDDRVFRPIYGPVTRLRLDGSEFLGEGVGARFRWGGKDARLFVIQDVTAMRQAEDDLRVAKESAEQANAAKSRFLAATSHDLRQPLYAMSLFLTTLMERIHDPAYANLLEKMEQSLESANKLLGTVLDISKLEAGVVMPDLSDFPIQSILDQAALEFAPVAETQGNSLTIMPCSAFVRSDRALLESILRNLVSNAVRHTHGGRIVVGCRRQSGAIRIEVRDSGPGISPDKHAVIFDEFERLDNSPNTGGTGLGLGLAIVDRTARLLGYDIELQSELGKGSVFAFRVPLGKTAFGTPATPEPPLSFATPILRNATIVLIEDDPSILLAIPEYLSRWGCNCITADSIGSAIANLDNSAQVPDLVVADYHLGNGETGLDAIRILRSNLGRDIPAVIVTADTSPETARRAREQGIPMLTKPVRPAKLRAMLQHLLQTGPVQPLAKAVHQ